VINAEATNKMSKTVRLILGDQLNSNHSWFNTVDDSVVYVMMEVRSETIMPSTIFKKVVGFFAAMQAFIWI
jgi:deoxyribodipyrimidine photolyase-related protein